MSYMEFIVGESTTLMPFLMKSCVRDSRTTVKSYLSHGQVTVNGEVITQCDHSLEQGDVVAIDKKRETNVFRHPKLRIVFEDEHLIVVDKHNGLLSVGTDKEREKTAFYILSRHVKQSSPRNRIFIVHRLDRETSGLMIFAKSEKIQEKMQREWTSLVAKRCYVAVVEGKVPVEGDTVSTYLMENRNFKVFAVDRPPREKDNAVRAVTHYRVLRRSEEYSLLEFELETGKKNQIRAHMEYIGHPISGDLKYGGHRSPIGRVALHAYKLSFVHPVTGRTMRFSTAIPQKFDSLIG